MAAAAGSWRLIRLVAPCVGSAEASPGVTCLTTSRGQHATVRGIVRTASPRASALVVNECAGASACTPTPWAHSSKVTSHMRPIPIAGSLPDKDARTARRSTRGPPASTLALVIPPARPRAGPPLPLLARPPHATASPTHRFLACRDRHPAPGTRYPGPAPRPPGGPTRVGPQTKPTRRRGKRGAAGGGGGRRVECTHRPEHG